MNDIAPPTILQLEVTKNCNFACIMCHKGQSVAQGQDFVRTDISETVLKQVAPVYPYLKHAMLFGDGEPMVYRNFWNIVRDIREASPQCAIDFINNGSMMHAQNRRRLFEYKVSALGLSIGGATAESHNATRPPGMFDKIVKNYRDLYEEKQFRKTPEPYINVLMVVMRANHREIPELIDLCDYLGARSVSLQKMFVTHPMMNNEVVSDAQVEPYMADAQKKAQQQSIGFHHYPLSSGNSYSVSSPPLDPDSLFAQSKYTPVENGGYCVAQQPWNTVYVLHSGKVVPDCHWWTSVQEKDLNACGVLGEGADILDVWNGAVYQQIRSRLADGKILPQCRGCGLAGGIKSEYRSADTDHSDPSIERKTVNITAPPKKPERESVDRKKELLAQIDELSETSEQRQILLMTDVPEMPESKRVFDVPVSEFTTTIKSPTSKFLDGYRTFQQTGSLDRQNPYLAYLMNGPSHLQRIYDDMAFEEICDVARARFLMIEDMAAHGFDQQHPIRLFKMKYARRDYHFTVTTVAGETLEFNAIDGHHRVLSAYINEIRSVPVIQERIKKKPIDVNEIIRKTDKERWKWYQPIDFGPGTERIEFQNPDDNLNGRKKYEFIIKKNMDIRGKVVLDLGCNTGVISAAMAEDADLVIGIDDDNHIKQTGFVQQMLWKDYSNLVFKALDLRGVDRFGSFLDSLSVDWALMANFVYYLGGFTDSFMHEMSKKVPNVLLQGNTLKVDSKGNRTTRCDNMPDYKGEYSTINGMVELLHKHGYRTRVDAPPGYLKPVVVGEKNNTPL